MMEGKVSTTELPEGPGAYTTQHWSGGNVGFLFTSISCELDHHDLIRVLLTK